MNILYHHRTEGDGAEGIHIREMVRAFRSNGHYVELVSVTDRGEATGEVKKGRGMPLLIKKKIPSLVYEMGEIGYNVVGFTILANAVRRRKPNFIYERYSLFNLSAGLVGHRYGVDTVLEVNAPLAVERAAEPDERLILRRAGGWFERVAFKRASGIVVVSSPLREYIVSQGIPERKILLLPNGVDEDRFRPMEKDPALMERYRINAKATVIGFSGIFRKWHGLELLLGAFKKVVTSRYPVHLFLIGDGPLREWIEGEIRRLGINGVSTITGRIPFSEMPRVANLIDIAVSPSATFYASPMKILEYMALGKAVVAPSMDNIRDIIDDNSDGILFPKDSPEGLYAAFIHFIENRELYERLCRRARQKIVEERNWRKNARCVAEWVSERGWE